MRRYRMLGLVLLVVALLSTGVVAALAQDTPTTFPYLGVDVVPNMNGAQVVFVEPDSPASQADVRYLDVIAKIDNDAVTAATLGNLLHNHQIGDAVTLDIQRGEENVTLQATLSARPDYFPPMLREEAIRYNAQDNAWRINVLSENEPLYESGLRPGDSILKFGDYAMTPRALSLFLEGKAPSDHIAVTIQRGDQEMTLEVPVSALRTLEVFSINFFEIPFEILFVPEHGNLGVISRPLDETVAKDNNLDVNEGALVLYVIPDSAAAMAGVQAHDVITAVNGEPVNTEVTLPDRLIAYEGGDIVQLTVQRGSDTMMIDATLANSPVAGLPYPIAPELGTNEARPNNG